MFGKNRALRILMIVLSIYHYAFSYATLRSKPIFEEDFLNGFFRACYIDTLQATIPHPSLLKFSYICNGYGNHWQIFIRDSKDSIVLSFDEETKPQNGIMVYEANGSGLRCYAIVDWDYMIGENYKSDRYVPKGLFDSSLFPKSDDLYIPPFPIDKSITEIVNVNCRNLEGTIQFDKTVINPDNILYEAREMASVRDLGPLFTDNCINPDTYFGYYVKQSWGNLYDEDHDKYDFTPLDNYFKDCVDYNTRLTLRIDQTEGDWDLMCIKKPSNWDQYEKEYSAFLNNYQSWFFDDEEKLRIDGCKVTGSYPSKLFFEQILEGNAPMIKKTYNYYMKDSCYTSFFNYNSESVYDEWVKMQKAFYRYVNKNKTTNRYGKKIKYKLLIENLYAAVGITGEGYVGKYGIFPDNNYDYLRYYYAFPKVFKDIPVSYPLAVTYDNTHLSKDELKKVLNQRNTLPNGRSSYSGLWYDVIGLKGYMPYSYYTNSGIARLISSPKERRFCGEGAYNDDCCSQVLTHAYLMHLSGVSQHNIPFHKNAQSQHQQQKYITVAGAKLSISDVVYKDGVLSFGIQNIGYCRVFSPYWKPQIIIRDDKGRILKKKDVDFDLFDIEPNSYDYPSVGDYVSPAFHVEVPLKLLRKAYAISFAIVDRYGIYENYWLHNEGRKSFTGDANLKDGEYVIYKIK